MGGASADDQDVGHDQKKKKIYLGINWVVSKLEKRSV